MFWNKKAGKEGENEKLSGPQPIPALVLNHLTDEKKVAPDLARALKAVVRKNSNGGIGPSIRIFDESEALARREQVKDYSSLDAFPGLIIYEGEFDEGSEQVKIEEKKKICSDTCIFTQDQIQQKIEALSEPGSTVFFYMALGSSYGGPLGKGAVLVELNPSYPGKKQKKYNVYPADVIDLQPAGRGEKLFDMEAAKDVARWVKERHQKRTY